VGARSFAAEVFVSAKDGASFWKVLADVRGDRAKPYVFLNLLWRG